MENFAHIDAAICQSLTCGLDIGHYEIQSALRPWRRGRHSFAKLDRASGTKWCELNQPKIVAVRDVCIEPPPQPAVKTHRPINVRHRNNDDLKRHVDRGRFRSAHV